MTTRQQSVDAVVAGIVALVQAIVQHREGQIAGSETVVQAQSNLRDALRAVFGQKESAQ
jgi:hypothetical protein